ncbi:MAG: enoyl-CoA hydratase-related protein [Alphaproteobacteria bacterium]
MSDTSKFGDILYHEKDGTAYITFNRPEKMNAFRIQTYEEIIAALDEAAWKKSIGAIVLQGAPNSRAFATGGDVEDKIKGRFGRGTIGVPVEEIHNIMRMAPKPVIAKVRGYAIGGGNVLVTLCDMAIASENAIFGQVGPKMGSIDPGYGTALLARVVGEKKAREIWYLCRRYNAQEALEMGLVNKVVPDDQLDAEVEQWCAELNERSPTAIAIAKRSFNADTDHIKGLSSLGFEAAKLYFATEESAEGKIALREKRKPDFKSKMR